MTYRYKRSDDGTILRYKARCTVRGDRMKPYTHFNPDNVTTNTAERPSIGTIMALAAAFNLQIEQFDINSAFLHEKYNHVNPVLVLRLSRFDGTFKHSCRAGQLIGNLYGTPPASHIYFGALAKFLSSNGYHQADSDPRLFYLNTSKGLIFITITIDDFFVATSSSALITGLYNTFKTRYSIRRLGSPSLFLNWRISRSPDGSIHISQPHTIQTILEKHQLQNCNPKPTPCPHDKPLCSSKPSPPLTAKKAFTFKQTIGELRYIADSPRPDIAHIVSRLASDMHNPSELHWGKLRYVLKYLKGTINHGILYKALPYKQLLTYADTGFANSADRKSYTGIVHLLTASPIMWQSSKQKTLALSTWEAEYLSASTAAQQTLWLQRLLSDIGKRPIIPSLLRLENNAAIQVAKQTAPIKYRKYIDLRHHFLHHLVSTARISLEHVPSQTMLADILTKPLKSQRFQTLRAALNIVPPPRTIISVPGTVRPHTLHADYSPGLPSDRTCVSHGEDNSTIVDNGTSSPS